MPTCICQDESNNNNFIRISKDWKTTLFGTIYIQLDQNSIQIEDLINNWNSPPKGFLTSIDIIVENPNDQEGRLFIIHPLRSLIGERFDLGPFFDPIMPKVTTLIYISIFWCDLHYLNVDDEPSEEFIIEGIGPLISWKN